MKSNRPRSQGGKHEDWSPNPNEFCDQACDADSTSVPAAGKGQAALKVSAALEFNPAYVQLRFGPDVLVAALDSVGVAGWNDLLERLREANIAFSTISLDAIPPVVANLNFRGVDLRNRKMDRIDLRYVTLDGATLAGCSLRAAVFWWVRGANFQYADLRDARFEGSDLTGADFTGARTCGIALDEVTYFEEAPPVGLPAPLLAQCEALPPDHVIRRVERRLGDADEKNAR